MAAQRVARATREIKSGSSVSSRFSRTKAMASSVGTGKKSSRFLAGGLAVAYGGGAIMNRRGPAADRVNGIRNTGVYEF